MHSDFVDYLTYLEYFDDTAMGNFASTETMQATTYQHQSTEDMSSTTQRIRLDNIPEDVHYLIASELSKSSPSAVLALGQSSSALRRAAIPFMYRNLVLKKGDAKRGENAYGALLDLFRRDHKCDIAKHVRSITVKDDLPEADILLIINKIAKYGTLHKLNWQTSAHVSKSILTKLESIWPDLELSVRVLNRAKSNNPRDRRMDFALLSSPLLKKLAYNVFCDDYSAEKPARSEWPQLTKAIVAGGNLSVLQIQLYVDGGDNQNKVVDRHVLPRLMRFEVTPETRLPPLTELTIVDSLWWRGNMTYLWDNEHCSMVQTAMDWSKIRKLDFGEDMPIGFFKAFIGKTPNLKHLRFGVNKDPSEAARDFIMSAPALESLDINRAKAGIETLWPAIIIHSGSLRKLALGPTFQRYGSPDYLDFELLRSVANEFPLIDHLGWDVPCQFNADPKYLDLIATMNLRKLDLHLYLPGERCAYSARLEQNVMGTNPDPRLDEAGSKTGAIKIMETISGAQDQPLERLTLHFVRQGYQDRFQPYLMWGTMHLRRYKDDKKLGHDAYEVRGFQEKWSGRQDLALQILFDEE